MNHRAYRVRELIFYRGFKKKRKKCLLFALGKGSIFVLRRLHAATLFLSTVACVAGGFYGWLIGKPGTKAKTSGEAAGKWGEGNEVPRGKAAR